MTLLEYRNKQIENYKINRNATILNHSQDPKITNDLELNELLNSNFEQEEKKLIKIFVSRLNRLTLTSNKIFLIFRGFERLLQNIWKGYILPNPYE